MSSTPRTDEQTLAYRTEDGSEMVHASFAAELETELARLHADLERFTSHGLLDCHAICDQRDSAVSERDQLRAEVERLRKRNELLTDHYECKMNIPERVSNIETELAAMQARAEKAEAELAAEREKVRMLRSTLERRHTEQGYHRQYVDDVLDATKEVSK